MEPGTNSEHVGFPWCSSGATKASVERAADPLGASRKRTALPGVAQTATTAAAASATRSTTSTRAVARKGALDGCGTGASWRTFGQPRGRAPTYTPFEGQANPTSGGTQPLLTACLSPKNEPHLFPSSRLGGNANDRANVHEF